jgi:flagellar protein FliT
VNSLDTEKLINTYDRLSRTTGCMLHAAQRGDWERLVVLEKDCAGLVAELSALEREDALPRGVRARKHALIRKVLADDAAIRNITEPWVQQLGSMLDANRHEQRLLKAYGPPSAG